MIVILLLKPGFKPNTLCPMLYQDTLSVLIVSIDLLYLTFILHFLIVTPVSTTSVLK